MKMNEIFESISGEPGGFATGQICTFIRLQGCNCSCDYCDSPETQNIIKGKELSVSEILTEVDKLNNINILITGGEPLLQSAELSVLINRLLAFGYKIQIETNGTIEPSIALYRCKIHWIIDYKESQVNFLNDIDSYNFNKYLKKIKIYLKFIIRNKVDLNKALNIIQKNDEKWKDIAYIFSPMNHILTYEKTNSDIAGMIFKTIKDLDISDRCILGHQLHKIYQLK